MPWSECEIKTIPQEIVCQGVGWIHLACDANKRLAFVDTVMNFPVSRGELLDYLSGYQLLEHHARYNESSDTHVI
jgi:hypothetical protein